MRTLPAPRPVLWPLRPEIGNLEDFLPDLFHARARVEP